MDIPLATRPQNYRHYNRNLQRFRHESEGARRHRAHAHVHRLRADNALSSPAEPLPDMTAAEPDTHHTDTPSLPGDTDTPSPIDANITPSPSLSSEPEVSDHITQSARQESADESIPDTPTSENKDDVSTASSTDGAGTTTSAVPSEPSETPSEVQSTDPSPTSSDVPVPTTTTPEPTTSPPTYASDANNGGGESTTYPPEPITSEYIPPSPSSSSVEQWVPSSSAEAQWTPVEQTVTDTPLASSTPSAATSTEVVVAGVMASVSSSSSVISLATSASSVMMKQPVASAAGSSRTLTMGNQATDKGVTMSQSQAASASASASSSAEAASASSGTQGLSAGAKAGIAIGVIAAVGAALFAVFYCLRRRKAEGDDNKRSLVPPSSDSNPYAFSGYGAAGEKGSNLKRNGTQHSALDFSDGPLPAQPRSRWKHLSSLAIPFAGREGGNARGSVASGPGMAGVGSSPSRLDAGNPSFDHSRGAYPYARRSESDDDHGPPVRVAEDDASNFRNTNYDDWLAYDSGVGYEYVSPTISPNKQSSPNPQAPAPPSPSGQLHHPQPKQASRISRVPVPSFDPSDPPGATADFSAPPQADPKTSSTYGMPTATSSLGDIYDAYGSPQPVLQRLPFLRVTPPPVQATPQPQPQFATVGLAS